MKKMRAIYFKLRSVCLKSLTAAAGVLVMTALLGFYSFAETPGRVTSASVNIRKEANSTSEVLGSAVQGDTVSITSEVTDAAGTVWYEVYVDADTKGYIRSDLVDKTDGSAALAPAEQPASTTAAPSTPETPAEVIAVQPMSGKVKGSESVRVRSNASTTSKVVTTAKSGVMLTVTGQANDASGKVWYQVSFISDGAEVTGFIRNDYVALDGELVPADQAPAEGTEGEGEAPVDQPQEPQEPIQEAKDMDTELVDGVWYLNDNVKEKKYVIEDLFNAVQKNADLYNASQETVKKQKIILIVLVIVAVMLALGVTLLIFKIKDMMDEAYFEEVERDTVRNRGPGKKVMQTVGREPAGRAGGCPAGSRPGTPEGRPAGVKSGTAEGRPAGSRPGTPEGRPAGSRQGTPEGRPAGNRPGAPEGRPAGSRPGAPEGRPAGNRPGAPEGRPAGSRPGAPESRPGKPTQGKAGAPNPGWKSRNFMTDDDDEFEFEFLNWDGDDDQ